MHFEHIQGKKKGDQRRKEMIRQIQLFLCLVVWHMHTKKKTLRCIFRWARPTSISEFAGVGTCFRPRNLFNGPKEGERVTF